MILKSYWIKLISLILVLSALVLALKETSVSKYYLDVHLWLPLIFGFITGLEHWILGRSITQKPQRFNIVFMGASAVKLFSILIVTVVYLFLDKENVLPFIAVVFALYVIFTGFEVSALLKLVKRSS